MLFRSKWGNDSQCLLLEYFDAICECPSQIYHSALPFCPSSSWLHEYYSAEFPLEIEVVTGIPTEWGTCSCTVTFDSIPKGLACWKDLIAVGLGSGDMITFDGITGTQTAVLSGHRDSVYCLTFSLDGSLLVSGSFDKTVKLWDVQTGGTINTFHDHTSHVYSVSLSIDCTMIASGFADKTIHLWNIQKRECSHIIKQQ